MRPLREMLHQHRFQAWRMPNEINYIFEHKLEFEPYRVWCVMRCRCGLIYNDEPILVKLAFVRFDP